MYTPPLHDYQEIARDHLLRNPKAGLFLEMGYGKTRTTLEALTPGHLPALVVAPKRVAEEVWPVERDKWRPDLSVAVAAGDPAQRSSQLDERADVTVISKDNLADALRMKPYKTVVLDELSTFKGRGARWKTAHELTKHSANVWGLTGTPAPNGLLDIWPQVYLLDRGARLGKNITAYRGRYFRPGRQLANGVIIEWHLREGAEQKIYALIEDICLSMKGRIELPAVTYNDIQITIPASSGKTYNAMRKNLLANLDLFGSGIHTAANSAVLSGKLSQIAAGFLFVDEAWLNQGRYVPMHTAKVDAVGEVLEGTGSPVLIFNRFKPEVEMLRKAYPHIETIKTPGIIRAWNRGEVPALVAHPASIGHGLNLQDGGHTVCWMSLPWDLEQYLQGNGRIARQGQQNPVVVHRILAAPVDQAIVDRLDLKTAVQDTLRDALESPL